MAIYLVKLKHFKMQTLEVREQSVAPRVTLS